jgi:hypothetical protein
MGEGNRSVGAPICDPEGMAAVMAVMSSLRLGPGAPGPGDEWTFPARPIDETEGPNVTESEPAQTGRRMTLLRSLTRRG